MSSGTTLTMHDKKHITVQYWKQQIHHNVPYTQNNHSSGKIYVIIKLGTVCKGEKKGTVGKLYLYYKKEDGLFVEQEAKDSDLLCDFFFILNSEDLFCLKFTLGQ
jgi:hypothetical protein